MTTGTTGHTGESISAAITVRTVMVRRLLMAG
jgi:hypothetical protein